MGRKKGGKGKSESSSGLEQTASGHTSGVPQHEGEDRAQQEQRVPEQTPMPREQQQSGSKKKKKFKAIPGDFASGSAGDKGSSQPQQHPVAPVTLPQGSQAEIKPDPQTQKSGASSATMQDPSKTQKKLKGPPQHVQPQPVASPQQPPPGAYEQPQHGASGPQKQQSQRGPQQQQPQKGPQQQQPQKGPQQQHSQKGPQQQQPQRGPQQQPPWGPQQQPQRGPQQQPQPQSGPQQQPQTQSQRGPQQQPPWGPQRQPQRGPQQQPQLQTGSQQQPQSQRGPHQQRQRGPQQQPQSQSSPQQQHQQPQRGPRQQPHQQPQTGPQQQYQRGPQQQPQVGPQQQPHGGPQQHPQGGPQQQPQGGPQQPPQRGPQQQSDGDVTSKQISTLSIGQGELGPLRYLNITPGQKGRKILVDTNHLAINLGKNTIAYHYDVNLVPDIPKKFLRTVFENFRRKHFPKRFPAFDGRKNAYSSSPLPIPDGDILADEVTFQEDDGRIRVYKVEMKFANEVDMRPLLNPLLTKETPRDALQVVDVVLRMAPAAGCISAGQSFFVKPPRILDLGEGMEMYNGFYQSAIRGWKPFLNVDVAHKAFPKTVRVLEALVETMNSGFNQTFHMNDLANPLQRWQEEIFNKFIKGLRVVYEIPNYPSSKRSYKVNSTKECAQNKRFKLENGQTITVAEYFSRHKNYQLRYPHLPTLWVGSLQKDIVIPLELCSIEAGQVINKKMTENQTTKMIRYAATDTHTRKEKIMQGLAQSNHNQHPSIQEFGFSVSGLFERLEARVLDPPLLTYNGRNVKPHSGTWKGEHFLNSCPPINRWTMACVDRRPPRPETYSTFTTEILKAAALCGVIMNPQPVKPFIHVNPKIHEVKKYFQTQKQNNFDVIFVIVPNSGPQYSFVKTASEINVGCLTQCIKIRTLGNRFGGQTATNIMLKVNSKLNGVNHSLTKTPEIMKTPCMIMGADVTHPSPDARDIPSVAAVTASHDPKAFKYNICWRLQPPKMEIIEDLQAITKEQLLYFYKMCRSKPEKIIFFRDGVSEGQFEQVRNAEIRAIRAACKDLQRDGYEPAITFLVVQKRHHTRLFPVDPKDSQDRNCNVPAGTCVDTNITHPFMQDFYMVSHASIQGVAKPTKYCTLWDDNSISNDQMEELTYHLCHMFSRCNRSVSYPAPTYYAHLAAARAKVYIENERLDMGKLKAEFQKFQILDVIRKDKPMFFV